MSYNIYILGDSYSYGFKKHFNKYSNIQCHVFFAEYIMNINKSKNYIRQVFTNDIKNTVDNKKSTYDIIKQTVDNIKPDIMIFNFGQVDINFSYFYNKVYGVPYNVNSIINEYIRLLKKYSNKCKKIYVINFLPLFVDSKKELIIIFKNLHIKNLHDILTKEKLSDIFDINKYRKHLYNSNYILRHKIKKIKWKNEVIFVDFNRYIYDNNNYKKFRSMFYIQKKDWINNIHIPIDLHINTKSYIKTILREKLIPELNSIN